MGYIMPVDRYQSINYQERLNEGRLSLSPVNSTFHVLLDESHQEISSEYDRQLSRSFGQRATNNDNQQAIERIYAEMTGSGRYFNETI